MNDYVHFVGNGPGTHAEHVGMWDLQTTVRKNEEAARLYELDKGVKRGKEFTTRAGHQAIVMSVAGGYARVLVKLPSGHKARRILPVRQISEQILTGAE